MKHLLSVAGILGLLAVAPGSAHALLPTVEAATFCDESGAPAVAWTVGLFGPNDGVVHHNNVQVEVSVDDGPWTVIGTGALSPANGYGFTGSALLPDGTLAIRMRVHAVGAWSNGWVNEQYEYAVITFSEWEAVDYPVPTDCEPPPPPPPTNPGTGTPGYWKNHPEAWPVSAITIGNIVYTVDQAIDILSTPTAGDVTITMTRALIAAELNGLVGNDTSCIDAVLDDAQAWMAAHPAGSRVRGRDAAWTAGAPIASTLDDYNNGLLCAPHRD